MTVKVTGGKGSTDGAGFYGPPSGVYGHTEGMGRGDGNFAHAEGESYASGMSAHAEGYSSATGDYSHGESNSQATGKYSHAGGNACIAAGENSRAIGLRGRAPRFGQHAIGAGLFSTYGGNAQATTYAAAAETSDATAKIMTFDNVAPDPTRASPNVLTLLGNRAIMFSALVVARVQDGGTQDSAGWTFTGLVMRPNSGDAVLGGGVRSDSWYTNNAGPWDVAVTVHTGTSPNYLKFTVTGEAGRAIWWAARIDAAEAGW